MSYTPTNWKTGDVVTSAKLNKLENGVAGAGGALVVNTAHHSLSDGYTLTLDKTLGEILEAMEAGNGVVVHSPAGMTPQRTELVVGVILYDGEYAIRTGQDGYTFYASSDNEYPSYTERESDDEDDVS